MSTPKSLQLPSGVRQRTIETSRGIFAALEALPVTGVRERQPALLVPGYTGSKEDFLLILQALAAAGRQVIAIDMRGQYETPGGDDAAAYQLDALAADVTMIADWLGSGRADPAGRTGHRRRGIHLLGHSLGGLVAREVLLARAAQISSLTLMSSGPGALSGPRAAVLSELLAELDGTGPAGLRRRGRADLEDPDGARGGGRRGAHRDHRLPAHPAAAEQPDRAAGHGRGPAVLPGPDPGPGRAGRRPADGGLRRERRRWEPAAQEDMATRLGAQRVCIPAAAHSPAVEAPETTASILTGFWNTVECTQGRPARTP